MCFCYDVMEQEKRIVSLNDFLKLTNQRFD